VHRGHLGAARAAQAQLGLERVIFVPSGQPPLANDRPLAPGAHRHAMLRLAIAGEPGWSASDSEVARAGPSFTVDTVAALQAATPGAHDWFFLLGQDCVDRLPRWKGIDALHARLRFAILRRGPAPLALADSRLVAVTMAPNAASSTDVRSRLARGEALDDLVPGTVADYLAEHRFYQPQTD
jgi:nicotinate-nucleotide adenylyltransferase